MLNIVQPNICFIGSSNLSLALIGGLVLKGFQKEKINLIEEGKFDNEIILKQKQHEVKKADIVVLLVDPKNLKVILAPLKKWLADKTIVSMMAGINIKQLMNITGSKKVIRIISNPPVLTYTGTHVLIGSEYLEPLDKELVETIYSATGQTYWANSESESDAIIALSGSGPAYFFYLMESMIRAGKNLGLDEKVATALTLQTALGAAQMAITSSNTPSELRKNVTSPNGTTQAALEVFDRAQISQNIQSALAAAQKRSQELAQELSDSAK